MVGNVSYEPTLYNKIVLLKQRLFYSRSSKEKDEFENLFRRTMEIRDHLKRIEQGMGKWMKASTALTKAAKELGEAVDTPGDFLRDVTYDLEADLENRQSADKIRHKINMLNDLEKERKRLKIIRLSRDRATRKVNVIRAKRPDDDLKAEGWLRKEELARRRYQELVDQMTEVMQHYVDIADTHGVTRLITVQLSAFKLSQFQFFLNLQRAIRGNDEESRQQDADMEREWNSFTNRVSRNMENNIEGEEQEMPMQTTVQRTFENDDDLEANVAPAPAPAPAPASRSPLALEDDEDEEEEEKNDRAFLEDEEEDEDDAEEDEDDDDLDVNSPLDDGVEEGSSRHTSRLEEMYRKIDNKN